MIGERGPQWGVDWETDGEVPSGVQAFDSDAAVADAVASARRCGRAIPPVLLTGGDLARTLGVPEAHEAPTPDAPATRRGVSVQVDVGAVLVEGRLHWFVAHLVARRSWWRGRLLVAANASFIGDWNAAPRSHPGDGRLDVFDACPSLRVRLAARRRLTAGTHVPHPEITQRRTAAAQYDFDPPLDVYADGRLTRRARTLSVRVEPAALTVWIPTR